MSAHRFQAVLWDVDGTLIDTTELILGALDHAYRTFFGRSLPEPELRAIIGLPLVDQMRILGEPESVGTTLETISREFIRYYEANGHLEKIIDEAVAALVAAKRAGLKTALVTSKNDVELSNTLPRLGIASCVDVVVSADTVARKKPYPDGVLLALERMGVLPSKAIFIGDTVHDLQAGKSAGVARCAVMWGAAPRELLLAEQPEFVCELPSELRHMLGLVG